MQDSQDHPPIFLVGSERSGTTLLRIMLGSHPSLEWIGEFEYSVDKVSDEGEWPEIDMYIEWLSQDRIFTDSQCTINRDLDYPNLIKSFMAQMHRRGGKEQVHATCHRHFDRLLYIWPDARFIFLKRDGRDVARSCIGMGWAGNVWTGARRWMDAHRLWKRLRKQVSHDRIIEVRYEDLVQNPEFELKRLCEFVGVEYTETMLDYEKRSTYKRPDASLAYQWRHKLSRFSVRLVESRIADSLLEQGYELSGWPKLNVHFPLQILLRAQDRWARAIFRMRRYGVVLWASSMLSERVSMSSSFHKKVKMRINDIDRLHLR